METTTKEYFLSYYIYKIITDNIEKIDNIPVRNYGLAKFSFLRIMKSILSDDEVGRNLIENPNNYVIGANFENLKEAITKLFALVALDINGFIAEYMSEVPLFDYKNLFKNKEFCDKLNISVLTGHKKSIVRHPEDSFKSIYNEISS
jgi:hypothetical protein